MEFNIPQSLRLEHEELHSELARAIKQGGEIGNSAKAVEKILHPHFVKEEEYALPPLGLLPPLAAGEITPEMEGVLAMTDRLKAELTEMLDEHRKVVAALECLISTARREKKLEYARLCARFADRLILHAQNEEEVLYPAAILVGEYLKLKLI